MEISWWYCQEAQSVLFINISNIHTPKYNLFHLRIGLLFILNAADLGNFMGDRLGNVNL